MPPLKRKPSRARNLLVRDDQWEALTALAYERNVSIAQLIREGIDMVLKEQEEE